MLRVLLPLLTATWLALAGGAKALDLRPGTGAVEFRDSAVHADRPITLWYHHPAAITPDSPILFVLHGVRRNGRDYRDAWIELVERAAVLLIAPEFTQAAYPGSAWYNLGNMMTRDGRANPTEAWSYQAIERIFDAVRDSIGSRRSGYLLFGHSAGGQYVHRLVTFMPRLRIERAVAANPGWYTLPTLASRFPHGLAGSPIGESELARAFARPLTLLLGDADTDPNHPELNREPETMKQGPHRLARGQHFFALAQAEAARLGLALAWRTEIVGGVAHDNTRMALAAARILFE
ncbi:MAG: alpha/beta hydrolase [Alphaproteobacteria bacterium]|nr:alpha/beta hydrolase [Alphaproteobacteria bacterium]